MRTTLDLDPAVLSAARAKAAAEKTSLGRAVSDLALAGLVARNTSPVSSGFPILPGNPGRLVTDDLIAQYRDDN